MPDGFEGQSSANFRQTFTQLVGQMWRLKNNIPVWATEYGTKQRTFHGKYWDQFPYNLYSYSDTKPFWARNIANFVNMFNAGGWQSTVSLSLSASGSILALFMSDFCSSRCQIHSLGQSPWLDRMCSSLFVG